MDPNYEGKNLEKRLKQVAIASAYTLTPPTAYEPDEPPSKEVAIVEDKVLRVEQEGNVFKYKDT